MQERAGETEPCACAGYRRRMWKQVRTRPCSILIESKLGPSLLFYRDFRAVKCSISLEITLDRPAKPALLKRPSGGLICLLRHCCGYRRSGHVRKCHIGNGNGISAKAQHDEQRDDGPDGPALGECSAIHADTMRDAAQHIDGANQPQP